MWQTRPLCIKLLEQPQRQSAPSTSSTQYVSTPGPVVQDIASASSIINGIYLVDLDINMVNREFLNEIPAACQRHWALLCDTGEVSSVAPITFVPEIQLQPLDARVQLGDLKNTSTSTERQKRSQNSAPVLVISFGNSLVFSRKIITSTGFLPVLRPRCVSTSSGKKSASH